MGGREERPETLSENKNDWPEVAIVVLNWNNYEDTAECLESLKDLKYPNYEVIVVDNGSVDGSEEQLKREFKWCTFILNDDNIGFAGGNNKGIEYAFSRGFDYSLILNNDMIVTPETLKPLVVTAERNEKVAAVSGIIFETNSENIWYCGGSFSPISARGFGDDKPKSDDKEYETEQITGAKMLISKEFSKYHRFNEEYFFGFEDTELCWLAKKENWKLFVNPNSVSYHKVSSSSGEKRSPFRYYHNTRNRLSFVKRNLQLHQKLGFMIFFVSSRLYLFTKWILEFRVDLIYSVLLAAYDYTRGNNQKRIGYFK